MGGSSVQWMILITITWSASGLPGTYPGKTPSPAPLRCLLPFPPLASCVSHTHDMCAAFVCSDFRKATLVLTLVMMLQSVVAPHFERLLGKSSLRARQASARGGELQVEVDRKASRVRAAGQAVIVLSGQLHL